MPKEKKKKEYLVCCEVDMCAEHVISEIVTATNETIAASKAVEKCLNQGYFHANVVSCKRI